MKENVSGCFFEHNVHTIKHEDKKVKMSNFADLPQSTGSCQSGDLQLS